MATDAGTAADPGWEVLARVAAGDVEAFSRLVEAHQQRLLRLCERLLGDLEEARDAVQEVFLKAFRKAGDFRPQGQVYTWLYRIAVNHCLNRLRRRRIVRFTRLGGGAEPTASKPSKPPDDSELPELDPADAAPSPEEALAARRRWAATRRAIAKLPDNQRAVLVLVRFEGLSYREAALALGISEGAVESRLFRAMRRLESQDSATSHVTKTGRG